jgi:3-oxoacid CoA-transferase subunit A
MSKVVASPAAAVADIADGSSIAVGGFGLCGIPSELIAALAAREVRDLHVVSNNCGVDGWGLGILLASGQISRATSSYVGENKEFARQFLSGELEVELIPLVAEGGLPWRYGADGSVTVASPPKEVREFAGRSFVLEEAIVTDFSLVRAAVGDTEGNLVFHFSARNFNPLCAMAGTITIAEVERLVEPGEIDPDTVHLPGVFVQRVVEIGDDATKRIENRTVRAAAGPR